MPVPRISKEELKQQLDSGEPPVLVDARLKYPYEHSTVKLPGAIRYLAGGARPSLPRDRDIVVYDSDPHELASSHVAAELIREGYRLRVYVPFGEDWYGYSIRRLKENPSMGGYIVKAIFTGGR